MSHPRFVPSVHSRTVARRTQDPQDSLPFGEAQSGVPPADQSDSEEGEGGRRRPGRPRVWASEADRKRAYRERLAADFAEPDRLRRELRVARKTIAERDGEIGRLQRELARSEATNCAALDREHALERTIEALEAKVGDWRLRARALAERRGDEQVTSAAIDRRGAAAPGAKVRLELPDLRTKGVPPPRSQGPRP